MSRVESDTPSETVLLIIQQYQGVVGQLNGMFQAAGSRTMQEAGARILLEAAQKYLLRKKVLVGIRWSRKRAFDYVARTKKSSCRR